MHASSESLAAYLSRKATAAERVAIEAHLAACDACRAELAMAQGVLGRRRRRRRAAGALALLGTAAALIILVRPPGAEPPVPGARSELRAGGERERVAIITPRSGDTLDAGELTFVWSSAGPERLYRLYLLTQAGEAVWEVETSDTVAFLPPAQATPSPGAYVWYVDALGPGGESNGSGPVTFTIE